MSQSHTRQPLSVSILSPLLAGLLMELLAEFLGEASFAQKFLYIIFCTVAREPVFFRKLFSTGAVPSKIHFA